MEDSTVVICIDSQFAEKIAEMAGLGVTQNGFFVLAHTFSLIYMFVSQLIPLSIVTVEFGGCAVA